MRNFLFGACFALLIVFVVQYCDHNRGSKDTVRESTSLIKEQLKNVGKLIVTEGEFSQVHNYNSSRKYYFDALTFNKNALVVVDAKAMVGYDLSLLEVVVDSLAQVVIITAIPEPELTVVPDIKYYDVADGIFNKFEADDFNQISEKVIDSLKVTISQSTLMSNAKNRLISELQKLYVLTNSMGWTLEFKEKQITQETDWLQLDLID